MQLTLLSAAVLVASILPAHAVPATHEARYITTETLTDYDCIEYVWGPESRTVTAPGHIVTITQSAVDRRAAPTVTPAPGVAAKRDDDPSWTVSEVVVCASTRTETHTVTVTDPAYTQTVFVEGPSA
ncbi:hypothetical protein HDZ31DRAFT_62994 [Schizophyllum fasciatum]